MNMMILQAISKITRWIWFPKKLCFLAAEQGPEKVIC